MLISYLLLGVRNPLAVSPPGRKMRSVTIEFYGIPRQRAGRADITVNAATIEEALFAVQHECPGLDGLVHEGQLNPHYLLSINGRAFTTDLRQSISAERLLLLSADAGG